MKKKVWIAVKADNVGSGKISRRMVFYKRKKRKRFKPPVVTSMFSKRGMTGAKSDKSKSALNYPSSGCKIVFLHWQRLGFPFRSHREVKSITTSKAIQLIQQELKKTNSRKIIASMDACHHLFKADWFKYRIYFESVKLSLHHFFRYENKVYFRTLKKVPDLPRSWYKECLKDPKKLRSKYSLMGKKDDHPELTEELAEIWKQYSGNELTKKDMTMLRKAAANIMRSEKLNRKGVILKNVGARAWDRFLIGRIKEMLLEYKTYKPKHVGWLASDILIDEEIPKEIIRQNLFDKHFINREWRKLDR